MNDIFFKNINIGEDFKILALVSKNGPMCSIYIYLILLIKACDVVAEDAAIKFILSF